MHSQKEAASLGSSSSDTSVTANQDTIPSSKHSSRTGAALTTHPASSPPPGSAPAYPSPNQRDPLSHHRGGVATKEQPVHMQERESGYVIQSLYHKPSVAPKSSKVLAIAEEILRSKRRRSNSDSALWDSEIYDDIVHLRGASGFEIYDDIITILRDAKSNPKGSRPSLPPKPTWLCPRARRSSSQPGSRATWKKSAYEDIYDDIVVQRLREARLTDSEYGDPPREKATFRPQPPTKSPMLYMHPKVLELLRQLRERKSSGCSEAQLEDIYDDILSALAKDLTPDSPAPNTGMSPEPDAGMIPGPDTGMVPRPDTGMTPGPEPNTSISPEPDADVALSEGTRMNDSEETYVNLQPPEAVSGSYKALLEPNKCPSSPYEVPSLTLLPENEQPRASSTSSDTTEKRRVKRISEWSLYENECLSAGRIVQYREEKTHPPGVVGRPKLMRSRSELVEPGAKELLGWRSRSSSHFGADAVAENSPDAIESTTVSARQSKSVARFKPLPAGRKTFDPLPEIQDTLRPSELRLDPNSDSGSETYEDLPLYEDLWGYQPDQRDDPYQDVASVVAKALDLPEMRQRATRITIGHRKQLKRFAKTGLKKLQRTQSLPNHERPPNLKKRSQGTNSDVNTSDRESSDATATRIHQKIIPEEGKASESDEEEPEAIPFGKSREVFEMLLDASGIERIAENTTLDGKEKEESKPGEIEQCVDSEEEGEEERKKEKPFDVQLLDESKLRQYKELEAGVIYVRSRSEIEAEIRQLTESAAPEPPPLPGLQRKRTKIITRAEKVRHKRFLTRRTGSHLDGNDNVGGSDSVPSISEENNHIPVSYSPADEARVPLLTLPPLTDTRDDVGSGTEPDTRDHSDSSSSVYDDIVPKGAQVEQRRNSLEARDHSDSDSSVYDDVIPKSTQLKQRRGSLEPDTRDHSDSSSSVYDDIVPKGAQVERRRNSLEARDHSDSDSSVYDDVIPKSTQLKQRRGSLEPDTRDHSDSSSSVYDDIVPKSAQVEQRRNSLDARHPSDSDSSVYDNVIPKRITLNQRQDLLATREHSDSSSGVYDDVIPQRVQLDGHHLSEKRELDSSGVHNDINT